MQTLYKSSALSPICLWHLLYPLAGLRRMHPGVPEKSAAPTPMLAGSTLQMVGKRNHSPRRRVASAARDQVVDYDCFASDG